MREGGGGRNGKNVSLTWHNHSTITEKERKKNKQTCAANRSIDRKTNRQMEKKVVSSSQRQRFSQLLSDTQSNETLRRGAQLFPRRKAILNFFLFKNKNLTLKVKVHSSRLRKYNYISYILIFTVKNGYFQTMGSFSKWVKMVNSLQNAEI